MNFVLHHIGGRDGTRSFPKVSAFEHEFVSVMYEASEDGNEQIFNVGKNKGTGETILVNACVGRPEVDRTFYLNKDPYTSSLLKLDPQFKNFYMQGPEFDYVMGDVISPVRLETITTESLDKLSQTRGLPECDFLSIDTQGSELEILQHAENVLSNCVGVKLEVAFVRRYLDQPLFGEIDTFLTNRGFIFVKFTELKEWSPLENGVEVRGSKMQVESDAIYFKSPANLRTDQFYPMIFTCLAYGQTEYALFLLRKFGKLDFAGEKSEWMKFCDKFFEIAGKYSNNRPTFNDKFSVEQSFARFVDVDRRKVDKKEARLILRSLFWRVPGPIRSRFQTWEGKLRKRQARRRLESLAPTEIEELFESVGLSQVSQAFKRSRVSSNLK